MNSRFLLLLFALLTTVVSCDKYDYYSPHAILVNKSNLVGSWESLSEKYEILDIKGNIVDSEVFNHANAEDKQTYVFSADKTGTYTSFEDEKWTTDSFSYRLEDKTLVIVFKDESEIGNISLELEFAYLIQGNKLYLSFEGESEEEGVEKVTWEFIKK